MLFGLPGKHPKPKRRKHKPKHKPTVKPKPTTPPVDPPPDPPAPPTDPPPPPPPPVDPTNLIPAENQRAGTRDWAAPWAGYSADNNGTYVGAFASAVSVAIGSTLDLKVRVPGHEPYTVDVYRLGWYSGLGGRFVTHVDRPTPPIQPAPVASKTVAGRIQDTAVQCTWSVTCSLPIESDWVTGVYLAIVSVITSGSGKFQSIVPFMVRDDTRAAPLLYLSAMTNYQAYNNYPDDGTSANGYLPTVGRSLYDSNSGYVAGSGLSVRRSAARVSFDRPWSRGNGISQMFDYEVPLIQFLERFGYDVSYAADLDIDQRGEAQRHKAILIAGHSEYWSRGMYQAVIDARDAGTSVACFSSNSIYWQVRFEDSRRTVVGYKNSDNRNYAPSLIRQDPTTGPYACERWRDAPLNKAECGLLGVQYVTNSWCDPRVAGFPLVPKETGHWAFEGTGLTAGVPIQNDLAGYEIDTYTAPSGQPAIPRPVGSQAFATLMESPFTGFDANHYTQHTVIYQAASGALVFSTGSMGWALGLTPNAGLRAGYRELESPGLQQLTRNVLDRMIA